MQDLLFAEHNSLLIDKTNLSSLDYQNFRAAWEADLARYRTALR